MFKKAFTLIELLVVIAIIGILSSIIIVGLSSARAKARDSERVSDIKNIQTALEMYYNDYGFYPFNIYSTTGTAGTPAVGLAPNYMGKVPTDPNVSSPNCSTSPTSDGCYTYVALWYGAGNSNCNNLGGRTYPTRYHLGAVLEESNNSVLTQDADTFPSGSSPYTDANGFGACSNSLGGVGSGGSKDFDGTSVGGSSSFRCTATAGTVEPNGTETCYDVTTP